MRPSRPFWYFIRGGYAPARTLCSPWTLRFLSQTPGQGASTSTQGRHWVAPPAGLIARLESLVESAHHLPLWSGQTGRLAGMTRLGGKVSWWAMLFVTNASVCEASGWCRQPLLIRQIAPCQGRLWRPSDDPNRVTPPISSHRSGETEFALPLPAVALNCQIKTVPPAAPSAWQIQPAAARREQLGDVACMPRHGDLQREGR